MSKKEESVENGRARCGFDGFKKRSGVVVPFRRDKIESAISRAVEAVTREHDIALPPDYAITVTDSVIKQLKTPTNDFFVHPDENGKTTPNIEDVQDLVEIVLAETGETMIVAAYKRYRKRRDLARRRIRVRAGADGKRRMDVTDATLLLVQSTTDNLTLPWDRERIVRQIMEKTRLSTEVAVAVAKAVENRIIASDMTAINSTLIRELVNNELSDLGYTDQLRDLSIYRISRDFIDGLMYTKSTENSNIVNNNAEAVNLGIAELVLKQWALDTIFSAEVRRAHDTGAIHLHDLGYPHRVYCSSHSIEYVKKYGLRSLTNLNTESKPARSASVLTGHLNTFLASMQANYAGALGIAYINIFYAPFLEGLSPAEYKQIAQELIFNGSQNAFSRGGQTLFLDFNIHTGVPRYLRSVPAIGPGGTYMLRLADGAKVPLEEVLRDEKDSSGYKLMDLYYTDPEGQRRLVLREHADADAGIVFDAGLQEELKKHGESIVTYGDYDKEARQFCRALLQVFTEGDRNGRVFEFPKCDFHVSDETFEDPAQYELYVEACALASRNGSTYFIFDRDEVTLSACCRLRTTINDNRMLRHPECMRFCGFQNVTINIPQCAFKASRLADNGIGVLDAFYQEIDDMMELVCEAHLQKKRKIAQLMSGPGYPLWQIGRPSCDGLPYVNLETCTYIIGLIGVNDAVHFLIGQHLHESNEAMRLGLKIVAHMYLKAKKLSRKHGLKFTLEESPAESAARRLAMTDMIYFGKEASSVVRGDTPDVAYYTNSVHLLADAPVPIVERIRQQAKFHSMIESGAITHAFVGEERPCAEAIALLMREVFFRTQSAQVTISPEFTYCDDCGKTSRGLLELCPHCGSTRVTGETRVVGYFSKVQNWNKSKRFGELIARQRGLYAVERADEPPDTTEPPPSAPKTAPRRSASESAE